MTSGTSGTPEDSPDRDGQRGDTHVAQLAEAQRARVSQAEVVHILRMRRLGRRLGLLSVWVGMLAEWLLTRWRSPRYRLGWLVARWQLLAKRQAMKDPRLIFALVVIAATTSLSALDATIPDSARPITNYLVAAAIAGFVILVWNDWVQSPFRTAQLRWAVRRRPELVLPFTPATTTGELVPREDLVQRIPREDLYEEAILGVLPKDRRDVQVIVGEPGSGKTTALVGLAERLARIGMIPVFVPLRANESAGVTLDIVKLARERFERQVRGRMRSENELNTLWQWLYLRRRIVVLTDDVDQIGPDGEKGFVLRRTLESLASKDVPVIVTARPAGIPAGVAASAISLTELQEDDVVEQLNQASRKDPGARRGRQASPTELRMWVQHGRLTEVPFYLELLSALDAVGRCPRLAVPETSWSWTRHPGKYRSAAGKVEWNPHWVRFMLLESYYDAICDGQVHRWLAIRRNERRSCVESLETAALGIMTALAVEAAETAKGTPADAIATELPNRSIESYLGSNDRSAFDPRNQRKRVSAHEVVDAGERLRLLDRTPDGDLQFRHRIMQAYLAARELCRISTLPSTGEPGAYPDFSWYVAQLLDDHHPEKLSAHMTLLFAALIFDSREEDEKAKKKRKRKAPVAIDAILLKLMADADARLGNVQQVNGDAPDTAADVRPPPRAPWKHEDPTARVDPDDGLLKLTTAADIAHATQRGLDKTSHPFTQAAVVKKVMRSHGATRWTKLGAIRAVARLDIQEAWEPIWQYICDPDYEVRRAASSVLDRHAHIAYVALKPAIDALLAKAAERSALGHDLVTPEARQRPSDPEVYDWSEREILSLTALGWVLPAIVSGLREEPDQPGVAAMSRETAEEKAQRLVGGHGGGETPVREPGPAWEEVAPAGGTVLLAQRERDDASAVPVRDARHQLDQLVALALQRGQHNLQSSLAQGFKADAMRHADDPEGSFTGPGWVASNRRLVAALCLVHAEFWYARMLLHQALGLYAIAGADRTDTLNMYARLLRPPREPHPFAYRAACLARRAVARHALGSERWKGLIWTDEGEAATRRSTILSYRAARVVADVTLLLNLNEISGEDRQAQFGYTEQLPHCLSTSPDRREILGAGCPPACGWEMCSYRQPPPDEPNSHRGVSRAFCRQQQRVAASRTTRRPSWQRAISRRALVDFWREMERRART